MIPPEIENNDIKAKLSTAFYASFKDVTKSDSTFLHVVRDSKFLVLREKQDPPHKYEKEEEVVIHDVISVPDEISNKFLKRTKEVQAYVKDIIINRVSPILLSLSSCEDEIRDMLNILTDESDVNLDTTKCTSMLQQLAGLYLVESLGRKLGVPESILHAFINDSISNTRGQDKSNTISSDIFTMLQKQIQEKQTETESRRRSK